MLINFIGFYVAWFGLVILGDVFVPFAIALIAFHLVWMVGSPLNRSAELCFIVALTLIGSVVDNLLTFSSVFIFSSHNFSLFSFLNIPLWLVVLWACFAATVSHSLKFLSESRPLQALVGAVCAPMSYIAGEKFEAVEFGYSLTITFVILSVVWACVLVGSFELQKYCFQRYGANNSASGGEEHG